MALWSLDPHLDGRWPLLCPPPPHPQAAGQVLLTFPALKVTPSSAQLGLLRVILTLGGAVCSRCKQPVALECISF